MFTNNKWLQPNCVVPQQTEVYSKSAEKSSTNLNITPEVVFVDKKIFK
jgi:hypothetical protein